MISKKNKEQETVTRDYFNMRVSSSLSKNHTVVQVTLVLLFLCCIASFMLLSQTSSKMIFDEIYSRGTFFADDVSSSISTNNQQKEEARVDSQWCSYASEQKLCDNSTLMCPNKCYQRYLIIVATARSGSTTMTQMLNMLPGVRVTGENNDALSKMYNLLMVEQNGNKEDMNNNFRLFSRYNLEYNPFYIHDSWGHNPINRNDLTCAVQNVINSLNPPPSDQNINNITNKNKQRHSIKGFKEFRMHLDHNASANDVVTKIKETLPCSRVVINFNSNITKQTNSHMHAFKLEKEQYDIKYNVLRDQNKKVLNIYNLLGSKQSFIYDSNMYHTNSTKALEQYNSLSQWLGFKDCTYQQIVHANANHSFNPSHVNFNLGSNCRYDGDWPAEY